MWWIVSISGRRLNGPGTTRNKAWPDCSLFSSYKYLSVSAGILMVTNHTSLRKPLYSQFSLLPVLYSAHTISIFLTNLQNVIVHRNWNESPTASWFYLQWANLYIWFAQLQKANCSPLNILHWLSRLDIRTNQSMASLGLLVFAALILLSYMWVKLNLQKVSAALNPLQLFWSALTENDCSL